MRGLGGLAVDANAAFLDEALHRAARDGGEFCPQKNVKPPAGQRFLDNEIFRAREHFNVTSDGWREVHDGQRLEIAHVTRHLSLVTGFGVCSFFQVMRKISPTPVQMAVSATLKAGKPISPPSRCCR